MLQDSFLGAFGVLLALHGCVVQGQKGYFGLFAGKGVTLLLSL